MRQDLLIWLLRFGGVVTMLTASALFKHFSDAPPPMFCVEGMCWEGPLFWKFLGSLFLGVALILFAEYLNKKQRAKAQAGQP